MCWPLRVWEDAACQALGFNDLYREQGPMAALLPCSMCLLNILW